MRPLNKEFKPRTGLRPSSGGSLGRRAPTDTAKNSKCAMCLERIRDPTYLNPCNHRFCFDCIQRWSRKKVICPLCKEPFYSFFHTVNTRGALCEYVLPLKGASLSGCREGHTSASTQRPESPLDNGILHEEIKGTQSQREKDLYQLMKQFTVTKKHANIEVISLGKFKTQAVIHFRKALYRAGIQVQTTKNPDFNRIPSAELFRRNPRCFDRLIPWLKRELKVLCGNQRPLIHTLLNFILNNMTQHDLQSKDFEDLLRPHFHQFTAHFLHEFISFVQSPFNLKKYDWNASYACPAFTQEDSNSSDSSASSDAEHSQLPDNEEAPKTDGDLEDGDIGCFDSTSQKDLTDAMAGTDGISHTNDEGNDLEDLSNSDTEKGTQTPDSFLKIKISKNPQSDGSLSHPQSHQSREEDEGMRVLQPAHTHSSKHTEVSKNSSNVLGSGDYNAIGFDDDDVVSLVAVHNSAKEEAIKWKDLDFPIGHSKSSSSERHAALSPGRKGAFKKCILRDMECNFEEGYSSPKEKQGGRGRGRHPNEGRHHSNYSRDRKLRREPRKSKSREMSLLLRSSLPLRSESLVVRDIRKSKSQSSTHFRKQRSKDYDYLRNRVPSEPGWRYLYYRQDCERYRYDDPLYRGVPARVYSQTFLPSSRERSYFPSERRISQESFTKNWYDCSERCKSTGRPRGRFAVVGQERGPYDKLGGKRRHKLHHVESSHSRGGPKFFPKDLNS
ncbi:E3 ubiquitin-protein ligase Topors-like [Zootoca vivipara]|uniref:E3 ubiquitin-protein ligase Topors-like n=1 Tax=Zootoca vivipara TaxID=8524 RepID=UPI00293BBA5E|nr:E3 ubiquitin-protein ligase Topors-like [Zootoca vivipara]